VLYSPQSSQQTSELRSVLFAHCGEFQSQSNSWAHVPHHRIRKDLTFIN